MGHEVGTLRTWKPYAKEFEATLQFNTEDLNKATLENSTAASRAVRFVPTWFLSTDAQIGH